MYSFYNKKAGRQPQFYPPQNPTNRDTKINKTKKKDTHQLTANTNRVQTPDRKAPNNRPNIHHKKKSNERIYITPRKN